MSKCYKINEEYLVYLLSRSMELDCLERDGVDNWSYYGESFQEDIEERAIELQMPLFKLIEPYGVVEQCHYDYQDIAKKRLKEFELII